MLFHKFIFLVTFFLQLLLTFDPIIVEKVAILLLNMMVVSILGKAAFLNDGTVVLIVVAMQSSPP